MEDGDFDLLGVNVVLRDGSQCTLAFSESRYLLKLIGSPEPVLLRFGSIRAVNALKDIIAEEAQPETTHSHADPGNVKGLSAFEKATQDPPLLLELLETTMHLDMPRTFHRFCVVFRDILRSCIRRPPLLALEVTHLEAFHQSVCSTFHIPVKDSEDDRNGRKKFFLMDDYFFPRKHFQNMTHSVDPAMVRGQGGSDDVFESDFSATLERLSPFRNPQWEPDDASSVCPDCHRPFSNWSSPFSFYGPRASHCRCCGKRKCASCTAWQLEKSVAKLSKPGFPEEGQMRKACRMCFERLVEINKHTFLYHVFINAELPIVDIALMRCVNEEWRSAAELCLSDYRNALYEHYTWKSTVQLSTVKILKNSASFLVGHPEPLILLLLSLDWSDSVAVAQAEDALLKTIDLVTKQDPSRRGEKLKLALEKASKAATGCSDGAGGTPSQNQTHLADGKGSQGGATTRPQPPVVHSTTTARGVSAGTSISRTGNMVGSAFSSNTDGCPRTNIASHWHLLCTRCCGTMMPEFFAIKILEYLHRAPSGSEIALRLREVVTTELLLKRHIHPSLREALIPQLMDLFALSTAEQHVSRVLCYLATQDGFHSLWIVLAARTATLRYSLNYVTLCERIVASCASASTQEQHQRFLVTLAFMDVLEETCSRPFVNLSDLRACFVDGMHRRKLTDATQSDLSKNFGLTMKLREPMNFPFNSSVCIECIDVGGISVKSSKQRPILIPLLDTTGNTYHVLYKAESLDKDLILCAANKALQYILRGSLRRVSMPSYHVVPLSTQSGLIEIVRDAHTVQDVSTLVSKDQGRLFQYLISLMEERSDADCVTQGKSHSAEEDASTLAVSKDATLPPPLNQARKSDVVNSTSVRTRQVREHFLSSAMYFILFNYLFAIGDRHRDNVMITSDGAIFHIDFGMILTTKTYAERVTTSYVRFDADLEECVLRFTQRRNERVDEALLAFFERTAKWFLEIRPYAPFFFQLLCHLVQRNSLDDVRSPEQLARLMDTIMMRGSADATCRGVFCSRVKQSRGQSWLKDLTHDTQRMTSSLLSSLYQRALDYVHHQQQNWK